MSQIIIVVSVYRFCEILLVRILGVETIKKRGLNTSSTLSIGIGDNHCTHIRVKAHAVA